MSLNDDVQLKKAEHAWKPSVKNSTRTRGAEEAEEDEQTKTREVLKQLRGILNKLTPQRFQALIQQVKELKIDTEDRLKGAIDLIFEKAILEPNFSVAYANMCRCLIGVGLFRCTIIFCFFSFAPVMTDSLCHVSGPLSDHDGFEELMEPTLITLLTFCFS